MKVQRLTGSMRQIADALGVDRSILSRIVKERGIKPADAKGAHLTFYVRDCADAVNETDPARMAPSAQLALARAARERLKLEQECGRLCPTPEVEQGYARIMKAVARMYDTLPDLLERDCGASGSILARIERVLDASRVELHRMLATDDGAEAAEAPAHE